MTSDFFIAFGNSPFALLAYVLLHLHLLSVSRRVTAIELTPTVGSELGANITRKAAMTPAEIEELKQLQAKVRADVALTSEETARLATLLAKIPQSRNDDPNTWLVNEESTPNLDGSDYKREQLARDARETVKDVSAFLRFVRFVVSMFRGGR